MGAGGARGPLRYLRVSATQSKLLIAPMVIYICMTADAHLPLYRHRCMSFHLLHRHPPSEPNVEYGNRSTVDVYQLFRLECLDRRRVTEISDIHGTIKRVSLAYTGVGSPSFVFPFPLLATRPASESCCGWLGAFAFAVGGPGVKSTPALAYCYICTPMLSDIPVSGGRDFVRSGHR